MKKMTFSFGRLNPPTIGHGKLLDALKKASSGEYRMYLSNSHDRKKNPLSVADKVKYTRLMFPKHSLYIMNDSKIVNVFNILVKLHDEGYEEVTMVVGSDRVADFRKIMEQYNGVKGKRHGFYDFKRITVKSAGERDPDATGVEGMSASKMRKAVSDNDFDSFKMGLPPGFRKGQELFDILKTEMGVKQTFREFVELNEFNVETRAKGSIATWSSSGFEKRPRWLKNGFSAINIALTPETVFEIINPDPSEDYPIIGNGEKTIIYTNVYSGPPAEGALLGTVAWKTDPSNYFKELKLGDSIVWGKNTPALETTQTLGVYLKDVDTILSDVKNPGPARKKWTPIIKKILANGQDWDSKGRATLLAKIDKMPDGNWTDIILHAKGMRNFINEYGNNLGTSLHIIHDRINDYYTAETNNQTTSGFKDNTADVIIANVSASELIKAVEASKIIYNKELGYCHTEDEKIKYYQISLKKGHDNAQLGKMTGFLKHTYGLPSSTDFYASIVEGWFTDKLKGGLTSIKSVSSSWWESIKGLIDKIKNWGSQILNSFDRQLPKGRPNKYQINLIQNVLREDGRLREGQVLNEARLNAKSINQLLKDTDEVGALKILKEVNDQIKNIQNEFNQRDYMVHNIGDVVNETEYRSKQNWKDGVWQKSMTKLFANATALNAYTKIVFKNKDNIKELSNDLINLEKEIYFGKTTLPLFKVYGAKDVNDTETVDYLKTQDVFTSEKQKGIGAGEGFQWPLVGFQSNRHDSGKYYSLEGHILTDVKKGIEPEYTQCRMGTNKSDAFSFVFEGTLTLSWARFKKKYSIK